MKVLSEKIVGSSRFPCFENCIENKIFLVGIIPLFIIGIISLFVNSLGKLLTFGFSFFSCGFLVLCPLILCFLTSFVKWYTFDEVTLFFRLALFGLVLLATHYVLLPLGNYSFIGIIVRVQCNCTPKPTLVFNLNNSLVYTIY